MLLHADAVTQNRAPGVGAGGVDGDNSDRVIVLAIEARKLIDKRALPRSWRTSQPEHTRLSAVRKQRLQQLGPSRSAMLDSGNRASEGTHVAGAELVELCLDVGLQAISVKQRVKSRKWWLIVAAAALTQ